MTIAQRQKLRSRIVTRQLQLSEQALERGFIEMDDGGKTYQMTPTFYSAWTQRYRYWGPKSSAKRKSPECSRVSNIEHVGIVDVQELQPEGLSVSPLHIPASDPPSAVVNPILT